MKKLSEQDYLDILNQSKVIESDKFGEKVLKYKENYVKLFRLKRIFSSALIYPYWLRFVNHAKGLKKIGIPTLPTIIDVIKVPHIKKTAVIYEPLQGDTIKDLIKNNSFDDKLTTQFGEFVAMLHRKGVYFSSLHLGNVVLTPNKEFGLIDISDMRIVPMSIPLFALKTNMRYLFQSRQGLNLFQDSSQMDLFISAYLENITKRNKQKMADFLKKQKEILLKKREK